MDAHREGILGIDLGKTSCRVRFEDAGTVFSASCAGVEGFAAAADNTEAALHAVQTALDRLPDLRRDHIREIGIGAAGVEAGRDAARVFAQRLADEHHADVMVITDVLAAHAGALGTGPGTVLVAGTGAVAVRIGADGTLTRADGWGIWLGDDGSGRWIGQEGLRRVLQAHDGTGPATALTERARSLAGSLDALPRHVSRSAHPERTLASFAPAVLEEAARGDRVADAVVQEAVRLLVRTTAGCSRPDEPLALVGGLTSSTFFAGRLTAALGARGLHPRAPEDDALAGAARLSADHHTPHERFAIRVQPHSR